MIDRRRFLSLSLGSALGAAVGSSLAGCRPRQSPRPAPTAGPAPAPAGPTARAIILLYMNGGPSQIDTFDPKPGTDEAAGVGAIDTAAAGVRMSSLLPRVARRAGDLAVIRSIVSAEGNHQRARHLMHTGYAPAGGVQHPALGALLSAERPQGELPGYVAIGGPGADAGFLGAAHAPFVVGNPGQPVRNLAPPADVDDARLARRVELWRALEDGFAARHPGDVATNQRAVAERALAMMGAAETVAFDLDEESAQTKELYGEHRFGMGCLMARRLVEVGVPFIEVTQQGWDTHTDHADRTATLCAELDQGMSALLSDLADRGLLDSTLVVWAGDFGRTPWMNGRGGRDHYPAVTPAVLAGGGVRGGQVIGATDDRGHEVVDRPLAVPDLFASIARAAGLDPDRERTSRAGRPIATVDGGTVIDGLF
jgi:hypothetical protein